MNKMATVMVSYEKKMLVSVYDVVCFFLKDSDPSDLLTAQDT